jgi:hypothetical protein
MADLSTLASNTSYPGEVFGPPKPLRRGSITLRYVKCGKPGCPCSHDKDARHGPYSSLAVVVDGRQKTVHLSEEEAEVVSRQIAEWKRCRSDFDAWVLECERCADEELEAVRQSAAEKGGSKRRSRRVLRPKSKT